MSGVFLIQQLAYSGPVIIVYLVGVGLAVTFMKKYPVPALLTLLAMIMLLGNIFGVTFVQAYLIRARLGSGAPMSSYNTMQSMISILGTIMRAVGSALLLAAVFLGRKRQTVAG
jgi:hypothetical protein